MLAILILLVPGLGLELDPEAFIYLFIFYIFPMISAVFSLKY